MHAQRTAAESRPRLSYCTELPVDVTTRVRAQLQGAIMPCIYKELLLALRALVDEYMGAVFGLAPLSRVPRFRGASSHAQPHAKHNRALLGGSRAQSVAAKLESAA